MKKAKNDTEKNFYKLLNWAFCGKTMENVRNRIKREFIRKDDSGKIIKQPSKTTFERIRKSYTIYNSYTFKQNEVFLDEPIYLRFGVLELSKLLMYERYCDKFQPCFGEKLTITLNGYW